MSRLLRALLPTVLLPVLLLVMGCRGPSSLSADGTPTRPTRPTPSVDTTPTLPPLPTPSVEIELPPSCALDRALDPLGAFLGSLSRGDVAGLRNVLGMDLVASSEPRPFAVIPREPETWETGLFTEKPESFLDWVERRSAYGERWSVLEFVRFVRVDEHRVIVVAALLREADDLLAKPMLGMIEVDCREGVVLSVVIGAVGAEALPGNQQDLLAEALLQRPLRSPESTEPCPRSSWAFGRMVGEGPVYLGLGPDAVVNLEEQAGDSTSLVTTDLLVTASERGPIVLRLFRLPDREPLPLNDGRSAVVLQPSRSGQREVAIRMTIDGPGCYVLQADGATWQVHLVFEVVADSLAALAPMLTATDLPAQLRAVSAVRDGPETVRIALLAPSLVARLSIGVAGPGGLTLGPDAQCLQVSGRIPLCWVPHPVWGWPQAAVWEDGMRRYHLVVLAGNRDAWSDEDLLEFVRRVSAPSGEHMPF